MQSALDFRPFTVETLDDAKSVVRQVFGDGACRKLEVILGNPALQEVPGADSGEILYMGGRPVGFDAGVLRKMYCGKRAFWGVTGSTLCLLPEARKEMACFDLMKKIVAPRFGSEVFFGNTANKMGLRITRAFGIDGEVPSTTAQKRIAVLRPALFAMYLVRSRFLKMAGYPACPPEAREPSTISLDVSGFKVVEIGEFTDNVFNRFWEEYISCNRGYVCSRSAKELRWIWGDRQNAGRAFVAGAYRGDALRGYAVFCCGGNARSWRVLDFIAIENDLDVLSAVLRGGLKLLTRRTKAAHCEISGYPDFVQPVIRESFPIVRDLSNNQFTWKFHTANGPAFNELNSRSSWFFGPYDGDDCL